jgi:hypothetical protein
MGWPKNVPAAPFSNNSIQYLLSTFTASPLFSNMSDAIVGLHGAYSSIIIGSLEKQINQTYMYFSIYKYSISMNLVLLQVMSQWVLNFLPNQAGYMEGRVVLGRTCQTKHVLGFHKYTLPQKESSCIQLVFSLSFCSKI